ncbi:MAG: mevalonate kinase [Marinilabiliales bacterium]|nr:MAG: mevalonate kinase [Marinilabiliales bacterium]
MYKTENGEEGLPVYYSKILLFGEYSVIEGSMALAVPFGHFTAGLGFINRGRYTDHNRAVRSNGLLKEYLGWLERDGGGEGLKGVIDADVMGRDVGRGLFLESNIPEGYGLGSSGAVVAALYDRYAVERIDNSSTAGGDDLLRLKKIFAAMESFFHGTSSGLDPLNCYFGRPVMVGRDRQVSLVGIPEPESGESMTVFLVDTGRTGKTGPLVERFLSMSREEVFGGLVRDVMIPSVNDAIDSLVGGDAGKFRSALGTLSRFQLENMHEMIPDEFTGVWERGLVSGDYLLKLCGSGGGGFLLGFTGNLGQTSAILRRMNMEPLPVYMNIERYG